MIRGYRWVWRTARILAAVAVGLYFCISGGYADAATISQGFITKESLTPGALVSTDVSSRNTIVYANTGNNERLVGVVVPRTSTSIALSNGTNQVQVATNGVVNIFVTNRDGPIKIGDQIAPSFINGVGSLAHSEGKVVGTAQGGFNGTGKNIDKRTVGSEEVSITTIPVLINVGSYTIATNSALDTLIPPAVKDAAQRLAGGHPVSSLKILLSIVALILGIISSTIIVYGAIRAALISIGRNPLSGIEIRRNLVQVVGAGLVIVTLSVLVSYFVLIW